MGYNPWGHKESDTTKQLSTDMQGSNRQTSPLDTVKDIQTTGFIPEEGITASPLQSKRLRSLGVAMTGMATNWEELGPSPRGV